MKRTLIQPAREGAFKESLGDIMKKAIIANLFIMLAISACMTMPKVQYELSPDEAVISYIDQHGQNKYQAFTGANIWIAKHFNSAKDVIQMSDKDAGILIVKAVRTFGVDLGGLSNMKIFVESRYTLYVQIDEQKIKMEFTTMPSVDGSFPPKDQMQEITKTYREIHDGILQEIVSVNKLI